MAAEVEGGPNVTAQNPEGTTVKSTGVTGTTKFLRADGDGTSSWIAPTGGGTVSKYNTTVSWDVAGGQTIATITHNLGTDQINASMMNTTSGAAEYYSIMDLGFEFFIIPLDDPSRAASNKCSLTISGAYTFTDATTDTFYLTIFG